MSNNNPYEDYKYNSTYVEFDNDDVISGYDKPRDNGNTNILDMNGILVKSFLFMFIALIVTGVVAMYVASNDSLVSSIFMGAGLWVIIGIELAMLFLSTFAMSKENVPLSIIGFFGYSVCTGLTFSGIFAWYSIGSISHAFVITAVLFLLMAVYGLITKREMNKFGDFAVMALLGVIAVSVVNLFIGSSSVDWFISVITVVLFLGITAWDTKRIREMAEVEMSENSKTILGLWGAMQLYLDFINIFLKLVRLLGRSDD